MAKTTKEQYSWLSICEAQLKVKESSNPGAYFKKNRHETANY